MWREISGAALHNSNSSNASRRIPGVGRPLLPPGRPSQPVARLDRKEVVARRRERAEDVVETRAGVDGSVPGSILLPD